MRFETPNAVSFAGLFYEIDAKSASVCLNERCLLCCTISRWRLVRYTIDRAIHYIKRRENLCSASASSQSSWVARAQDSPRTGSRNATALFCQHNSCATLCLPHPQSSFFLFFIARSLSLSTWSLTHHYCLLQQTSFRSEYNALSTNNCQQALRMAIA